VIGRRTFGAAHWATMAGAMDFSQLDWVNREVILDTCETTRAYVVRSKSGKYIRLSPSAFRLVQHAQEGRSVEELAAGMGVPVEEVRAAYARLAHKLEQTERQASGARSGFLLRYDVIPARWVVKASGFFTWAFHRWSAALLLGSILAVVAAFLPFRPTARVDLSPVNALWGYSLYFLSLLVHEFGHSSACLRYGASPSSIGVGVYLVFPVLYSDVSAAWSLSRWQRAAVDLGGIYLQSVAGALFLGLYVLTGWPPWLLAVAGVGGTVLFSLNPLFKFDGYWAIADMLGVSNFSQQGTRVLRHAWDRLRGRQPAPLPWPAWVVGVLGVYTVLSFGAIIWLTAKMAPYLVERLVAYPEVVRQLVERIRTPGEPFGLEQLGAFLGASFGALLAGVILWRLVAGLAGNAILRIRARLSGPAKVAEAADAERGG
jgi:putative peptide zinc metalloprotease protein